MEPATLYSRMPHESRHKVQGPPRGKQRTWTSQWCSHAVHLTGRWFMTAGAILVTSRFWSTGHQRKAWCARVATAW